MVVVTSRPPDEQRETLQRLHSYRRDREVLDSQRAELLAQFPEEWVAVHDGRVFHARELDSLLADLQLEGVDPTRVPREYLTRDEPALLL